MELYTIAAVIIGFSALTSVFSTRVLRMPDTIGLMATGVIAGTVLLLIGLVFPGPIMDICERVTGFDFSAFVLHFVIGFLLFGGACSADAKAMNRDRCLILTFATFGILVSNFIVGVFSLPVQSLTLSRLVNKMMMKQPSPAS